jgi:hypothetical protein
MVGMFTDILYYLAGCIFIEESQNTWQPGELTKGGDCSRHKLSSFVMLNNSYIAVMWKQCDNQPKSWWEMCAVQVDNICPLNHCCIWNTLLCCHTNLLTLKGLCLHQLIPCLVWGPSHGHTQDWYTSFGLRTGWVVILGFELIVT